MSANSSAFEVPAASLDQLTAADLEVVAEIVTLVANSIRQGCLYFGICNNRLKIASVEAAIRSELRVQGIEAARLLLAERHDQDEQPVRSVLIEDPIAYFAANKPDRPTLSLVHGLPELIRAETAGDGSGPAPVSQRLNYGRELFHRQAICALFWIDPETARYLAERARDFWSFRSGTAQFDMRPAEQGSNPEARGAWQTAEPGSRWLGDLQEKLDQLAAYRSRVPADESAIASLLLDIGRLRVQRGEAQQAFEPLHQSEEIVEHLGDQLRLRDAKAWLSRAYDASGRMDRAEEYVRAAIAIDERLGNEPNLAIRYNNLGQIYQARGQSVDAEQWLRKSIAIDERLGDEPNLAIDYNNLSQIYQARGQLADAEQWLRKAIAIDERLGNEPNLAIRYNNLGQIYRTRGQLADAEQWLRKACALAKSKGDASTLATIEANLEALGREPDSSNGSAGSDKLPSQAMGAKAGDSRKSVLQRLRGWISRQRP